jgi:hypothetical protein
VHLELSHIFEMCKLIDLHYMKVEVSGVGHYIDDEIGIDVELADAGVVDVECAGVVHGEEEGVVGGFCEFEVGGGGVAVAGDGLAGVVLVGDGGDDLVEVAGEELEDRGLPVLAGELGVELALFHGVADRVLEDGEREVLLGAAVLSG